MKRCTVRLGLSLMLALGWWVQRLPAQAPVAPLPAMPTQAPCACGGALDGGYDPNHAPAPYKGPVVRALNRHGLACFTSHNAPACGSLHSELTFFFGSCRTFFGEPCMSAPPRHPAPEYGR